MIQTCDRWLAPKQSSSLHDLIKGLIVINVWEVVNKSAEQ